MKNSVQGLVNFVIEQGFVKEELVRAGRVAGMSNFEVDERITNVRSFCPNDRVNLHVDGPAMLFSFNNTLCFVEVKYCVSNSVRRAVLRVARVRDVRGEGMNERSSYEPGDYEEERPQVAVPDPRRFRQPRPDFPMRGISKPVNKG